MAASDIFCSACRADSLPFCSGELRVIGSRQRVWSKGGGDRAKLVIRRLQCEQCGKIHHELPDLPVPYRRYDAASIEGVVAEPPQSDSAAEESTLARWRSWFAVWAVAFLNCRSGPKEKVLLALFEDDAKGRRAAANSAMNFSLLWFISPDFQASSSIQH